MVMRSLHAADAALQFVSNTLVGGEPPETASRPRLDGCTPIAASPLLLPDTNGNDIALIWEREIAQCERRHSFRGIP